MPSMASDTSTLSFALLTAWLGEAVPPTAELAHEAFQALARCTDQIAKWRPAESQWPTLHAIALDECDELVALSGAHSSSLAPAHANAMYGDFRKWPLYSSLIAGAANPDDPTWSFVAALAAWPALGRNVAGMRVGHVSTTHVETLQKWLRESLRNADKLAVMRRLIGDMDVTPQHIAVADKSLKGHEERLWNALKAHAKAYCRSYPESPPIPGPSTEGAADPTLQTAIRKIIDHSVLADPDNTGLAPEDAGATRYVSQDTEDEDPTGDCLSQN